MIKTHFFTVELLFNFRELLVSILSSLGKNSFEYLVKLNSNIDKLFSNGIKSYEFNYISIRFINT